MGDCNCGKRMATPIHITINIFTNGADGASVTVGSAGPAGAVGQNVVDPLPNGVPEFVWGTPIMTGSSNTSDLTISWDDTRFNAGTQYDVSFALAQNTPAEFAEYLPDPLLRQTVASADCTPNALGEACCSGHTVTLKGTPPSNHQFEIVATVRTKAGRSKQGRIKVNVHDSPPNRRCW